MALPKIAGMLAEPQSRESMHGGALATLVLHFATTYLRGGERRDSEKREGLALRVGITPFTWP
jgi:hypothetical protein